MKEWGSLSDEEKLREIITLLATHPEIRALFESDPSAFAKQYDVGQEELELLKQQDENQDPAIRESRVKNGARRYKW